MTAAQKIVMETALETATLRYVDEERSKQIMDDFFRMINDFESAFAEKDLVLFSTRKVTGGMMIDPDLLKREVPII